MASVISYDFEEMGDMQTKMRAGAFRSVNISFDMDKGLYKEVDNYNGEDKCVCEAEEADHQAYSLYLPSFHQRKVPAGL